MAGYFEKIPTPKGGSSARAHLWVLCDRTRRVLFQSARRFPLGARCDRFRNTTSMGPLGPGRGHLGQSINVLRVHPQW